MFQRLKLVTHPVRIRICQALHGAQLTTSQLHDLLREVPKPSLYRHLRILLENGLIQVAETHLVNGIEEKVYTIDRSTLDISQEDVDRGINAQELAEFALVYINGVGSQFAEHMLLRGDPVPLGQFILHDFAFFATDEEFAELKQALWQMLSALESRPPNAQRKRRRLLIVGHESEPKSSPSSSDQEESSDESA